MLDINIYSHIQNFTLSKEFSALFKEIKIVQVKDNSFLQSYYSSVYIKIWIY